MVKDDVLKRAIIAGASYALDYKEKNKNSSDSETMKHVTKNIKKIIENIKTNY